MRPQVLLKMINRNNFLCCDHFMWRRYNCIIIRIRFLIDACCKSCKWKLMRTWHEYEDLIRKVNSLTYAPRMRNTYFDASFHSSLLTYYSISVYYHHQKYFTKHLYDCSSKINLLICNETIKMKQLPEHIEFINMLHFESYFSFIVISANCTKCILLNK